MNEFAKQFLKGENFRLEGAGRQWGILEEGRHHILKFDGREVGDLYVAAEVSVADAELFSAHAAAIVHVGDERVEEMLSTLAWLRTVQALSPDTFNWLGVYYRASYLTGENSSDLILGPFIGEPTEHTRIPIDRGLCGLALREERVINQADVHADSRHIACSISTRSELIIPLPLGHKGSYFAELDIDSNQKSAFSPELEAKVSSLCQSFFV